MDDLAELNQYKIASDVKTIYVKGIGNFLKRVEFEDDDTIREVLKRNGLIGEDDHFLYQIRNQLINLDKTFAYYKINADEVIYILPEPAPLPYLIYLFHQKSGRVHCIELSHMDSVDILHKQVAKHLKIKEEDQILIYSGKCLNNKKTLQEEKLSRESLVTILDKRDIPEIEREGNEV
ncbi:ubiquitin-like protein, putative [Plasmodium ovale]|uniref:Ubiquitin-like protein, putative n=2 Tax=Plasmodium ovale TaxID=36330 RepID=A0A1C3L4P4_PLAOA|nr:ubiquitin-like protein, putative [Plasmodium ovale]